MRTHPTLAMALLQLLCLPHNFINRQLEDLVVDTLILCGLVYKHCLDLITRHLLEHKQK